MRNHDVTMSDAALWAAQILFAVTLTAYLWPVVIALFLLVAALLLEDL